MRHQHRGRVAGSGVRNDSRVGKGRPGRDRVGRVATVTPRSAGARMSVSSVTSLFVVSGSGSFPTTVAVFETIPGVGGVSTMIVGSALSFPASSTRLQVTTPDACAQPALALVERDFWRQRVGHGDARRVVRPEVSDAERVRELRARRRRIGLGKLGDAQVGAGVDNRRVLRCRVVRGVRIVLRRRHARGVRDRPGRRRAPSPRSRWSHPRSQASTRGRK